MRHLLAYYSGLLPRLVSSYLYLISLGLVVWWYAVFQHPLEWTALYMLLSTSLIGWFTVLFLSQIASIHHVFFRSDAVMICIARVRNRAAILGTAYILIGVLAVAYTVPYALIYARLGSINGVAMSATLNLLVFNLFVGLCGFATLVAAERGTLGSFRLVGLLFVIPNILNVATKLIRPENPWIVTLSGWATAHIRLLQNPELLLVREIQDTDVLVTTMVIVVLVSGVTFTRFVRRRSAK
jgi:hypothetical protein